MSNPLPSKTDLLVIGAGPGGYPAAFRAADLGLKVVLVDPEPQPGGVCLYRGCIPSKALLHVATFLGEARHAENWGIQIGTPTIDLAKLRTWKESVVTRLTTGLGALTRQRKITYVQGRARFTGSNSATLTKADGTSHAIRFAHAIIATGSLPVRIPTAIDSPHVVDSTGALALTDLPKRLLVVGGGYIGIELGQAYAGLGSEVTVMEALPTILTGADRELAAILETRLKKQFAAILTETRLTSMRETDTGIEVAYEGSASGKATFDKILVAVGRKPYTDALGLEKTGVTVTDRGFIEIDLQRRTSDPAIFAVGDVAGQPMLAHKATHEGVVAADAIAGHKSAFDPRAIPAIIFSDPELAWCGLTEDAAREQKHDVKVTRFPWAASGRATTLDRTDGLTKLLFDAKDQRLLGVGIAGPGAGELLMEGVLAMELGAVAEDLAMTIHAHPTLSETLMEAALAAGEGSLHSPKA